MSNVAGFVKRITGPNRIAWGADDFDRLRKIYGLTEKEAEEIMRRHAPALTPPLPINKAAPAGDLPTKWSFTASDGQPDRMNDVISVAGINLAEYAANPIWHYRHDFSMPIGMAPHTYKSGGKLKSTLELGLGVFPYAEVVQRGLASGMLRACSIGFKPDKWRYNPARDGVDFDQITLLEISAVTLPACAGAVLDGPVKSLPGNDGDRRAKERLRFELDLDLRRLRPCP